MTVLTGPTAAAERTPALAPLVLPSAPRVARSGGAPARRRRAPAVVLLVLGALLVVGPIAGGLFGTVAAGQQMVDAFAPHLEPDALGRYGTDLETLRRGADAVDAVYRRGAIPEGRHPGLDTLRVEAAGIEARATTLLSRIRAAEPDYRRVAGIGGFDRIPFLLVVTGLALAYAGAVLLSGRRRSGGAVLLALAAASALVAYPLLADLPRGGSAGDRLQAALAPVMTEATVRAEQDDFVVLVHAVGELDTAFRAEPQPGAAGRDIARLVAAWPEISSDLAGLVGVINDNLDNDEAVSGLDMSAVPWVLVGTGAAAAVAASAARPRRRKGLT